MMKMTSERVTYLYDLMDSAYDAQPIHDTSEVLGHVPIIDRNALNFWLKEWERDAFIKFITVSTIP